jgi:iron complex transport system ATP-binding protein
MASLFKVENLSGGYPGVSNDIVRKVSLEVRAGDFIGIIGPNGSGKTTFLRLATRVLHPREGNVYFRDKNICDINLKNFCREAAFVSRGFYEFPFTVMEFVLMGRIPHLGRLQLETKKDTEIATDSLSLTGAAYLREKKVDELSSGEQQRVLLARALAQEPILLFLDEPTSHLDIGCQVQIMDLLKRLNSIKKLTIVMILHDLNLASAYCNRIVLMDKGEILKEGRPEDVLTYQNIEAVYKTVVLVNENPVTHKPNVILVPGGIH